MFIVHCSSMSIAQYIEHTNLSPTLEIQDIDKLVQEASEYGFLGICVPPFWVQRAKREIGMKHIVLVTVAGFPLGYNMTETKLDEIKRAIDNGADEIDVVWNVSAFKSGMPWPKIEVAKCSKLVHDHKKLLKVIIETAYLNDEQIAEASKTCADAGADFVKTSTGFASAGAKAAHIEIMRKSVPQSVGIKASGGIKTLADAQAMIDAGASRIGTSSGVAISLSSQQTHPITKP
jgi:deoxyribose-phosphate aldolase